MKQLFLIFIVLCVVSCQKNITGSEDITDPLSVSSDKNVYAAQDTMMLALANKSIDDVIYGLRCNRFLEMTYQQYENGQWSDNLYFSFEYLACPTVLDTLKAKSRINYPFSTANFDSAGTFHLVVRFFSPKRDSSLTVFSNAFEIKK